MRERKRERTRQHASADVAPELYEEGTPMSRSSVGDSEREAVETSHFDTAEDDRGCTEIQEHMSDDPDERSCAEAAHVAGTLFTPVVLPPSDETRTGRGSPN